jgi:hypothetical protein
MRFIKDMIIVSLIFLALALAGYVGILYTGGCP